LSQRKGGLIKQVTSEKRFNSYEIFHDRTGKRQPLNSGDCLTEVTTLAGLTVYRNWINGMSTPLLPVTFILLCGVKNPFFFMFVVCFKA
jgi:hypothetical protein